MIRRRPSDPEVKLISEPLEVSRWAKTARLAADGEKDALGFLPEQAYVDAADQGNLIVATVRKGDSDSYVGHLLYGGVFPNARIHQVHVAKEFRKLGYGRMLVEEIVRKMERFSF